MEEEQHHRLHSSGRGADALFTSLCEDRFVAAFESSADILLHSITSCLDKALPANLSRDKTSSIPSKQPRKGGLLLCSSGAMNGDALLNVAFATRKNKLDGNADQPSLAEMLRHPLALISYVPKDASLFLAGAVAGAAAKSVTAPLDRIKILMQVHSVKASQESAKKAIGFTEAIAKIGREEGLKGYWKGNLPQVIRIIPYSAVQLFAYEFYKKLFSGKGGDLSVIGRLAAGACAGMTSTLITYPLDVIRLRLAVDPASKAMAQVARTMLREEGLVAFYKGLGPSLIGIAPYIALNFCAFDLIKKSLPEEIRKRPVTSFATALISSTFATVMCYPLDTIRRQMQMRNSPYHTVFDAIPGIMAKDGIIGFYRGFVPNALKNLPNSSIRLTTFDAAKSLINASQQEFQKVLNKRNAELSKNRL